MIAWKWSRNITKDTVLRVTQESPVLGRLKYLIIDNYGHLPDFIGPIDLNITLLEIAGGTKGVGVSALGEIYHLAVDAPLCWQNPPFFSNMPMLRVLVVLQNTDINVSREEISEIATTSFHQLPSLEYFIRAITANAARDTATRSLHCLLIQQ